MFYPEINQFKYKNRDAVLRYVRYYNFDPSNTDLYFNINDLYLLSSDFRKWLEVNKERFIDDMNYVQNLNEAHSLSLSDFDVFYRHPMLSDYVHFLVVIDFLASQKELQVMKWLLLRMDDLTIRN